MAVKFSHPFAHIFFTEVAVNADGRP